MVPSAATTYATFGRTANLNVYAAADPPLKDYEIRWRNPWGDLIVPDIRISLTNSNKRLVLRNVYEGDAGRYTAEVHREMLSGSFTTLAEVHTSLVVRGKYFICMIMV